MVSGGEVVWGVCEDRVGVGWWCGVGGEWGGVVGCWRGGGLVGGVRGKSEGAGLE